MATRELDDDETTADDEPGEIVDALELLKNDHDEVKQLFDDYEELADDNAPDGERQALAVRVCAMLTVHATIEEEILYPAARDALDDESLIDEATVEHASAKALIAEIESMKPSEPLYDAKVKVLGEYVRHHIDEEEEELLPQLADTDVDLDELGVQLLERKQELMLEMGLDELA